ncbi:TPA: aminopeptidase N [Corynebacterium striatum]|nr:aminopeptidase N [Corynebacterium striatum]NHY12082.1 aminopeptidase N [Corynebacterium striatum]NHY36744.1 aminopeptidase N [Corynebacterium striatum]HAT1132981.1 aminopeptidase N [Corynebacterium striatum]HAT1140770.1 aminopeptidase N [Corynebacterium striatum]HAT1143255.1 aminopeptidase N [Corynebacterium striatum]
MTVMSNSNSSHQAGSLTHAEAIARTQAIDLSSYHLHLDVSGAQDNLTFPVTSRITFSTQEPELFVDYLGEQVTKVAVQGEDVEVDFHDSRIYLHELPVGEEITVEIQGVSAFSRTGQGMHRMVDNADGNTYLYSHLEPSDARRIFPCFDQPDLKAVFYTTITAPEGWQVLSNQPEVRRQAAENATTANAITVEFNETPLLSTYLTSFAAGPYIVKTRTWRDIELRAFARASMEGYLDDEILEITAQGMDFFDEAYKFPYPWGKYDSIFVPEYNLGAMENPGLVTFTETYLFRSRATRAQRAGRTNTILHEMSHMWFGDLVTPQWWDDLWLKESFAEFMGADSSVEATEYTEAWTNFAGQRKNWAYLQDQLPTTHPIKADIPDVDAARQNFDGITYAKGASVLKQLVHYVGRENFYAGARDYFRNHAFAAATFDDLLSALKQHTDRDLDAWSTAWLKTWGPDTLAPELHVEGDKITELAILAEAEDRTRPHRLNAALFEASLHKYAVLDIDVAGPRTIVDEASGLQAPALLLLNDGDHTYAKVRFDETSLQTIQDKLSDIDDELSRAVIWTSLWNLTRDGEWPAQNYVDTVLKHAVGEAPSLLTTALANAQFAVNHYLPESPDYATQIWELLQQAEKGTDTHLLLIRAAINALGSTPEPGNDRLRAVLDDATDPDIRWAVLRALAAREAVSQEELDAEKERDNTLTGAAAYLGVSRSFPDCKREVFDMVREPGAYSNAEVDSLLAAFNAPRSKHLTEPFAEEFFQVLDKIWQEHPIEIANRLVRGLYPELEMADAATDEFLREERPRALRRVLLECQDHLRRTLRVKMVNKVDTLR